MVEVRPFFIREQSVSIKLKLAPMWKAKQSAQLVYQYGNKVRKKQLPYQVISMEISNLLTRTV